MKGKKTKNVPKKSTASITKWPLFTIVSIATDAMNTNTVIYFYSTFRNCEY